MVSAVTVSLREKGVDLNASKEKSGIYVSVSLREKGVDLNASKEKSGIYVSVSLREKGVDLNILENVLCYGRSCLPS